MIQNETINLIVVASHLIIMHDARRSLSRYTLQVRNRYDAFSTPKIQLRKFGTLIAVLSTPPKIMIMYLTSSLTLSIMSLMLS